MSTRFLQWREAQAQIAPEWSALVASTGLNPSLDPRWLDAVVRSHGLDGRVVVAARHSGDALVGVLPFVLSRERTHGVPLRVVDVCSNFVSYHPQIVAAREHEELVSDVLEFAHEGRWDILRVNNTPDDGPTGELLATLARRRRAQLMIQPGERSPYIVVEGSWDAFLAARSKKLRANVTRAVRRMKDAGETAMRWFTPDDDPHELLECILEIEKRSWKAQEGTAITSRPVELEYHQLLLPALTQMKALFANVLMIHDRPAAYVLCCRTASWTGQLKTSFDMSIADAGARVIDESIRRAFESGGGVYDFLGDATPHKLKWTERIRSHTGYWMWSSRLPARLAFGLKRIGASLRRRRTPVAGGETQKQADAD
jgi:CelD/BcsL family acetyltransferase involved in cellulose biosynthesis